MSDLISRQAAIAHAVPLNLFGREVMMVSVSELENLPSAQETHEERTETHACDLISRQAAIDVADAVWSVTGDKNVAKVWDQIKDLPSAQPELPKQFMSDDCISRSELYKKVCEAEKLARERVCDTPSDIPFPNKLNPAYTRYSAQLNERTQFKHMIADARSVQPEQRWIPCSERLPEEGERVLATHLGGVNPNKQVIEHIYQCGKFTYGWDMDMNVDSPTFGQRYMGEVIAWMPLPEPYKGGEQDE